MRAVALMRVRRFCFEICAVRGYIKIGGLCAGLMVYMYVSWMRMGILSYDVRNAAGMRL